MPANCATRNGCVRSVRVDLPPDGEEALDSVLLADLRSRAGRAERLPELTGLADVVEASLVERRPRGARAARRQMDLRSVEVRADERVVLSDDARDRVELRGQRVDPPLALTAALRRTARR